ncbi:MAG: hypothetical protein KDB00_17035 [Planctomycetales bacterium]|nr:hypothetical protein [Planctomycetales bacterium]
MSKSEIHAGYEFEQGMFSRMRSWEDVAPWIRLTRVVRVLASPILVGLVAITWSITRQMIAYGFDGELPVPSIGPWHSQVDHLRHLLEAHGWVVPLVVIGLSLLLWIPVIQFVARAGAALTSGQIMPRHTITRQLVQTRIWKSYLVPIVPVVCIGMFATILFLVRTPSFIVDGSAISIPTGWLIGIGSIPIGILGFGALFAIPLGLVAMVSEPDPDPIDSLSRGYESLYRRPLATIWYLFVCAALVYLASALLGGIIGAAFIATSVIVTTVSENEVQLSAAGGVLETIQTAWMMTLAFGLLGGIYLLLRRDTGGQDIDDFWTPQQTRPQPLPELPEQAYQS